MGASNYHTNSDGLVQHYGVRTTVDKPIVRRESSRGGRQRLIVDFDFNHLDQTTPGASWWIQDTSGGDTPDQPSQMEARLPAGSYIWSATLLVKDVFDSASDTATLGIGTFDSAGAAIDADGIDAAIAETALDAAGDSVECDGAQVGGLALSEDAWIGAVWGTEAFTAGSARLIVEYDAERLAL